MRQTDDWTTDGTFRPGGTREATVQGTELIQLHGFSLKARAAELSLSDAGGGARALCEQLRPRRVVGASGACRDGRLGS